MVSSLIPLSRCSSKRGNKMSEMKQAGASYIVAFYNDIMNLNHAYSVYLNLMAELGFKYQVSDDVDKASDQEKKVLLTQVQETRYFCNKTYLGYQTIKRKIPSMDNPKLEQSYLKVRDQLIFHRTELESFVVEINDILLNEVFEDFLTSSKSTINNLYKDDRANTQDTY